MALAGCNAAGEPDGAKRFSDADVPFTFEIPADFTKADIDQGNSRGDVVAGVGLSKVDVVAVRRAREGIVAVGGVNRFPHEVLGQRVTSELHAVPGFSGWALECQYTPEHADTVLKACRRAVATVRQK